MEIQHVILILLAGTGAGIMNTLAGGGGMLAVPLLIFLGLPATVANGSYRVAVTLQNVFAVAGFQRQGVRVIRPALWLLVPVLLGAAAGVWLAVDINEQAFRKVLAGVLLVMLVPLLTKRSRAGRVGLEALSAKWLAPAAFGLGFYGGFIQIGVGFLFLAVFAGALGLDLMRSNAVKVFLVLGYSLLAVVLFTWGDRLEWKPALALAAGNATGGWIGAHLAVSKGERFLRWAVALAAVVFAVKLWMGLGV